MLLLSDLRQVQAQVYGKQRQGDINERPHNRDDFRLRSGKTGIEDVEPVPKEQEPDKHETVSLHVGHQKLAGDRRLAALVACAFLAHVAVAHAQHDRQCHE